MRQPAKQVINATGSDREHKENNVFILKRRTIMNLWQQMFKKKTLQSPKFSMG